MVEIENHKNDSEEKFVISKESMNFEEELFIELKQLLPNVFTEGKIDWNKLKLILGEKLVDKDEKYSFNWAGREEASKNIQSSVKETLIPDKDESINFYSTENIFIEGDNLEALKLLQKAYFNTVKMIYIDPPYNTGKDFVYRDNFRNSINSYLEQTGQLSEEGFKFTTNPESSGRFHSEWISMMYSRLFIARNLLRDDGVIFVSIDDNEVHNLRLVMNEIFGEENFISTFTWKARGGRQDSEFVAEIHEYILLYSKNSDNFFAGGMIKKEENFPKYDKEKNRHYKTQLARKWGY